MRAWDAMQKAWIVFFSLVGGLNLVVAYLFETATWVNFKLFGLLGLTLMFTLGIGVWVAKLTQNNENNDTNS
jgi:intracellular septation protein